MANSSIKIPLSCFIVAHNEEQRIGRTIQSVIDWVDEVIVIDSGSTDKTVDIAGRLGARIIYHKWPGYGPQKRFGEEQCKHDWVLNLDADEVITPALQEEIRAVFTAPSHQVDGYHLYVVEVLPGSKKPLPLARKYNIVRLYNWRKIRYSDSPVHDRVVTGNHLLGQFKNLVHHHSVLSVSHAISKLNNYSDLQTKVMRPKSLWTLKLRLITEFPFYFLRFYIFRGYFMGGSTGFTYAMVNASFRFFRVAKMLEKAKIEARK